MSQYITDQYFTSVPLHYDTIYYVESQDNETLNRTMFRLQQAGTLFNNKEMQLFPIKLQYVSQKELDNEHLRSQLVEYDAEDVDDAIYYLRECLSADNGGTLTARYMPREGSDPTLWDVCSIPLNDLTSPDEISAKARNFARNMAETDFARLAGVSYQTYLNAREEAYNPSNPMMGFLTIHTRKYPDPNRIIQKAQANLIEIYGNLKSEAELENFAEMLESVIKMTKKTGKLNVFRPIVVKNDKIWLKNPDGKSTQVVFDRYGVAKTLYIFFLRKIESAAKNNSKPIYISKAGLMDHAEELLDIYGLISNSSTVKNIESLLDDFANALSSIRRFFKGKFDVEAIEKQFNKCYSIEIMGRDEYNSDAYGINLEPEDFDLGFYSIDNL